MVQPQTLHDMTTVVGMFCLFRYDWVHLIDLTIVNSESHQIGFPLAQTVVVPPFTDK